MISNELAALDEADTILRACQARVWGNRFCPIDSPVEKVAWQKLTGARTHIHRLTIRLFRTDVEA